MSLHTPELERYLQGLDPERHPVLIGMEERARERGFPIVGPMVGALLQILVRATGATRIFELGSGFGYSALWMALALPEGGGIVATEGNEENVLLARASLEEAGVGDRVEFLRGDALEILESSDSSFDLIFNDVDKVQYPRVLPLVPPRLRTGGLFLTDNVLWSGRVAGEEPDETTRAIIEFTRALRESPDFLTTILPLRDGVSISVRL